jgi:tyrosine phenol-lyase
MSKNILPPRYKTKTVTNITLLSRDKRLKALTATGIGCNVFKLPVENVFIDFLTDSGTSAMSDMQRSAQEAAHQAYSGTNAWPKLEQVAKKIFGYKHNVLVHQGRAAEDILCSGLIKKGQYVFNNNFFDTTEGQVIAKGGIPINCAAELAYQPSTVANFKGNMDIELLKKKIQEVGPENVAFGMITITNNTAGGQPVSLENIRKTSEVYHSFGIKFFIDACRYAENSYFIQQKEPGYENKTLLEIASEIFALADGCTFSAKKEGLVNIGGLLCARDDKLASAFMGLQILNEGFPQYGGMACRDLGAMAVGMEEAIKQEYQEDRFNQIQKFGQILIDAGVPVMQPIGGHAVYIDGKKFFPHLSPEKYPAQSLATHIYLESGVRGVELGNSCFGKIDAKTGKDVWPKLDLTRFAVPRRVYQDSHLEYVASKIIELYKNGDKVKGLVRKTPLLPLTHFIAEFESLAPLN